MRLGLFDLLAPQFLVGVRLPREFHDIVSFLRVNELQTSWDETGVVHVGKASFVGEGDASPIPRHSAPSGAFFDWKDVLNIGFRLTLPRRGSQFIKDQVDTVAGVAPPGSPLITLRDALNTLGSVPGEPSDYPGVAFRLELLINIITLHLPKDQFFPARVGADGWLEPDPNFTDVQINLPKIAVVLTQGDSIGDVDVSFAGWGVNSLDDPADPEAGELIAMVPPLALHESNVVGFGMQKAVLDLSADFTPPDIMELFGTGDDFTGLWLPHVRFFFAPNRTTGKAFDLHANDLLIDFNHGVSGEFEFDVMNRNAQLAVEPRLFEGDKLVQVTRGHKSEPPGGARGTITITGSRASVAADGELQLAISGGTPPYTVTVRLDGSTLPATSFNGDPNRVRWLIGATAAGNRKLRITVEDSSPSPTWRWDETIDLQLREPGTVIGTRTTPEEPVFTEGAGTNGYRLVVHSEQPETEAVTLRAEPRNVASVNLIGGGPLNVSADGLIRVPVTAGGSAVGVEAHWPPPTTPGEETSSEVRFAFQVPSETQIEAEVARIRANPTLRNALSELLRRANGANIDLVGRASYEADDTAADYNQSLSERRARVLSEVLNALGTELGVPVNIVNRTGTGFTDARAAQLAAAAGGPAYNPREFRDTSVTYTPIVITPTRQVSVRRPSPNTEPIKTPTERGPAPNAPESPPVLRSLRIRARLERNRLVLAEVAGQLDFVTQVEASAQTIRDGSGHNESTNLTVTAQQNATADPNANPGDGIVDFRLTMSYDSATRKLHQELVFGAGETDRDGLIQVFNSGAGASSVIGDITGALLIFAPLLAASVDSAVTAEGDEATVEIAIAATEIALATTLGLTGVIGMRRITWFGAALSATESIQGDPYYLVDVEGAGLEEVSAMFDYGVDFAVAFSVGPININSSLDTPLRVRYRALGFKLNFQKGVHYTPVFDTSKGYEIDLSDPGLFDVGAPLDKILKVLGARVARNNPLVMEVDIGLKVNLGVITVESMRITQPLDPFGPPTLLPTEVSVNIPGAVAGSGYLDLRDGIKGSLDLTLIPTKLRIMGALAIQPIDQDGRHVTGVFLGLGVEFPVPIPVGNSGLGLLGILGLFAMHFKRLENPAAFVPALDWLNSPDKADGNPTRVQAWGPDIDRWSFGVGVVLGTVEGGFILNLKGMLLLELPGPRILIFAKLQIIKTPPPTEGRVSDLGILAVVDLNFAIGRITIGVLISYEVKSLISLKVPVEASFFLDDIRKWHLYLGSIATPASAEVLGLVKAQAYLMLDGDKIANFPGPNGPMTLPGLAIALGIRASVVFGRESSGLYLKVSAALDAGISFEPFYIIGILDLRGKLRLFIVSISAWARLVVQSWLENGDSHTAIDGEVCGKVSFFFFSVKGCVPIHIGGGTPVLPAPPLLTGLVLQSRSPALIEGQGTDAPIDGSLGEGQPTTTPDAELPVVPIDVIPVLQMEVAPLQGAAFTTFTLPLEQAPCLFPEGWVDQGGGRSIRYTLVSLTITPPVPSSPVGDPPATWRSARPNAQGTDNSVELALFSWEPDPAPRAVERSTELTEHVGDHWEGVCDEVAPPAPVLWTFNPQPLGPSEPGWHMFGAMWPDPPDTQRSVSPDLHLHVHEPFGPALSDLVTALMALAGLPAPELAKVIGDGPFGAASAALTINIPAAAERLLGRVLQFPFLHQTDPDEQGFELPEEYLKFVDSEPQRIIVESDQIERALMLLAVDPELQRSERFLIRALDADSVLLDSVIVRDQIVGTPTNVSDLPATWQDTSGPWATDVLHVMQFLALRQPRLNRILVEYKPPADTVRLEIVLLDPPKDPVPPAVLLGVIELLRHGEVIRADHDEAAHDSLIATVEGALAAGQPRPLLAPNTRYTISLTYTSQSRQIKPPEDGGGVAVSNPATNTQAFAFKTNNAPPARLNPWVLATTPQNDEGFHFVDDALQIVFNDSAAIQLFEAYGKTLRAVVRQANGNHPTSQPPLNVGQLVAVEAVILTPYEDTLREVVVDLGLDACIHVPPSESHQVFTVPIELERGMAYTLDIETDDPPPDGPRSPLFRIAFQTGRFASADELAKVMRASPIQHRVLKSALGALPDTPADAEIEATLLAAGLDALAPSSQPGFTVLWEPVSTDFRPAALLVDAPEPLWRSRREPIKVTETATDGSTLEHWISQPRQYLELSEDGTSAVQQFVRSPGGTRTLAVLNPALGNLNLVLRQHELELLNSSTPIADHPIFSAPLPSAAPWIVEGE
jgi:hypothetical protein